MLAEDKDAARAWADTVSGMFVPDVVTLAEAEKKRPEFEKYPVVCLFNAARPPEWLWSQLKDYVSKGHGLFVVLGGNKGGPDPAKGYGQLADDLLPGTLEGIGSLKDKEQFWSEFQGDGRELQGHPILRNSWPISAPERSLISSMTIAGRGRVASGRSILTAMC